MTRDEVLALLEGLKSNDPYNVSSHAQNRVLQQAQDKISLVWKKSHKVYDSWEGKTVLCYCDTPAAHPPIPSWIPQKSP